MRDLTEEERVFFKRAINNKHFLKHRYWYCQTSRKRFKVSRLKIQLNLDKYLESWELVHHKDGNRQNDELDNLGIVNSSEHSEKHYGSYGVKPKNWKPVNATPEDVIDRIILISKKMVKINYSEISRQLEKEGIKITSMTVKKYISEL